MRLSGPCGPQSLVVRGFTATAPARTALDGPARGLARLDGGRVRNPRLRSPAARCAACGLAARRRALRRLPPGFAGRDARFAAPAFGRLAQRALRRALRGSGCGSASRPSDPGLACSHPACGRLLATASTALDAHPGSRGASAPAGTLGYAGASPRSLAGRGKPPAKVAPPGGGVASARFARSATLRATGGSPRGRPSALGRGASRRAAGAPAPLPRARRSLARLRLAASAARPPSVPLARHCAASPCPAALRSCSRWPRACALRLPFARQLRSRAARLRLACPASPPLRGGDGLARPAARAVAMEARFAVVRPFRAVRPRSRPGRCAASARRASRRASPREARDAGCASRARSGTPSCNSPPLRGRPLRAAA